MRISVRIKEIDITQRFCYKQDMNKSITKLGRITDERDDDFVGGSPGSRIALVWPLTAEVASLSKQHNVKRRLQRNVTVVNRRER